MPSIQAQKWHEFANNFLQSACWSDKAESYKEEIRNAVALYISSGIEETFNNWITNIIDSVKTDLLDDLAMSKGCLHDDHMTFGDMYAEDWVNFYAKEWNKHLNSPECAVEVTKIKDAFNHALAEHNKVKVEKNTELMKSRYKEAWSFIRTNKNDQEIILKFCKRFLQNSHRSTLFSKEFWLSKSGHGFVSF